MPGAHAPFFGRLRDRPGRRVPPRSQPSRERCPARASPEAAASRRACAIIAGIHRRDATFSRARGGSHLARCFDGIVPRSNLPTREEVSMLKNATYDLMETATVLSKGLHRYDTFKKDAHLCAECQRLWTYMRQSDEEQLARVVTHLKDHFAEDAALKLVAS
jgi:hypothetical protein